VIKFEGRLTWDSETAKYLIYDIRHFGNHLLEDISVYFYRSREDHGLYRKDSAPEKVFQQSHLVIIYDLDSFTARFSLCTFSVPSKVRDLKYLDASSSRRAISMLVARPTAAHCCTAALRERSFSNRIPVNPLIVLDSYRLDRRTSARDGSVGKSASRF